VETFTPPREFVEHPRFREEREAALASLDLAEIDEPIADIVAGFAKLPYCFTLQSCQGHFVCGPAADPHAFDPIPIDWAGLVRYRLAYIAFCIENSPRGRAFREELAGIARTVPEDVQFGSYSWFWARHVNSYALQVEPDRFRARDEAFLAPEEALRVERNRDLFFAEVRRVLAADTRECGSDASPRP